MKKHSESKTAKRKPAVRKKSGTSAAKRRVQELDADVADAATATRTDESELLPVIEGYDASALSQAKTQWFFGEWEALAKCDLDRLRYHPDRDRLALLVAAAQQQLGENDNALKSARLAIQWGCRRDLLAQVLVAGVHNTLGRAAALSRQDARAVRHFEQAVSVGASAGGSAELMGHARSVREVTKLGLLPDAAALMEKSLAKAASLSERPADNDARIRMLEAEIELLRGGLALAAQRKQLYTSGGNPADDREASTSQLGQDLWVLEQTGFKRGGYFVEFGATDGVLLSNTYLLERRYDWRGICAEPHPDFFAQLRRNRRCHVSDACVAAESGRDVEFILADEYGGIVDFAGNDTHAAKRQAFRSLGKVLHMQTTSLDELLTSFRAPREIDYLSLDTEGSEYEILRAFPFERWRIQCITVEHNFSETREPIRRLLESRGYARQEAQWDDWYVLQGAPQ
ncbi:MAG: FkbM family methyltransferase [Betaproteobacteria bacterium]|nr:FkbM family methyltransferase [Betaproteobacteria bacterium]